MYTVLTLNNISSEGLRGFPNSLYQIEEEHQDPEVILLRSYKMHGMEFGDSLKAVGRAGAGVNNVPVDQLSKKGIPVFNTPGANANAVKELVIAGLLLSARNICQAWQFSNQLGGVGEEFNKAVEDGKKKYAGFELPGRTLGVIGLGAIGREVANTALALGMKVVGFDPGLTVEGAWRLSTGVQQAVSVEEVLAKSDFVTFHVPLNDQTRDLINAESLNLLREDATLLNFARGEIVNTKAVTDALDGGRLHAYICDFPSPELQRHPGVIALPHLGASTREAEQNCAVMVVEQIRDYLENGNIRNSVNFPTSILPRTNGARLAVANSNVPNMVGQITTLLAKGNHNIVDMLNKSRGNLAYTLVDLESGISDRELAELRAIEGVLSVRQIG